jgi:outer membrane protein
MKSCKFTAGFSTLALVLSSSLVCSVAAAHEQGDWIIRAGSATVSPDESSSLISTTATGVLANTSAEVADDTQLGLTLAYMLTDNIGVELLAATPFDHDIKAQGLSAYGFNTSHLGSTKHLPPTLVAQYYFLNSNSSVRPYVGLGLNYTTFFSEDLSGFAENELAASKLKLDDSFGVAWQLGVDWQINDRYLLNASVWNLDIGTEAKFESALGQVSTKVDIDPWVYMVGIGYKF